MSSSLTPTVRWLVTVTAMVGPPGGFSLVGSLLADAAPAPPAARTIAQNAAIAIDLGYALIIEPPVAPASPPIRIAHPADASQPGEALAPTWVEAAAL